MGGTRILPDLVAYQFGKCHSRGVHLIRPEPLEAFWAEHPDAEGPLRAWIDMVGEARWETPGDVKAVYTTASVVGARRIVFNIGGNKYRLIVKVSYRTKVVFVRFVGTHAEYDEIDAATV